jgi:S1-C subfamily serine protease
VPILVAVVEGRYSRRRLSSSYSLSGSMVISEMLNDAQPRSRADGNRKRRFPPLTANPLYADRFMTFLQHYIFPICRYRIQGQMAWVTQLQGTGFFITKNGVYVTARHVVVQGMAAATKEGEQLGICPYLAGSEEKVVAGLGDFDFAPPPYDIVVGKVNLTTETVFVIDQRDVEVWQDVATIGYPESVVNKTPAEFQLQARAHKGYIQRMVPTGRMPTGTHPDVFEVSFPISVGLSGSPLFIYAGNFDYAIGVCVGSHQSRLVDYEDVVSVTDGKEERQTFYRVEEFGIAHDLRKLIDWKPPCLGGFSLGELGRETKGEYNPAAPADQKASLPGR